MQLAAIDWLSISIHLLLVAFVIVCLLMILMVLMQRPKQEGLGAAFGGGVTDQVFGARTTNVLQRGTVYMATLFFLLSLTLAVLIGNQNRKTSMLAPEAEAAKVEESQAAEDVEDAPETEEALPRSLLDELPAPEGDPAAPVQDEPESPADDAPIDDVPIDEPPADDAPIDGSPTDEPAADEPQAEDAAPADDTEESSGQP